MDKHTVLLIIDMINPFDYKDASKLYPPAYKCAKEIVKLRMI
ncbi:hypothetical protein [Bacillus sp. JCM 19041]